MSDDWKAALLPEVLERIDSEKRDFDPMDKAQWSQCAVSPFPVKIMRDGYGEESVFVVAREGQRVLFFDDAEDEFGGATLDAKGCLKGCGLHGDLKYALRAFRQVAR